MRYIWGQIQYESEKEKQEIKKQNKKIMEELKKQGLIKRIEKNKK